MIRTISECTNVSYKAIWLKLCINFQQAQTNTFHEEWLLQYTNKEHHLVDLLILREHNKAQEADFVISTKLQET